MLSLCVSGSASASVRDSVEAELISDSRLQWFSEKNEQSHRNESAKLFRLRIDTSNAAVDSNHRCDDDDELYDCCFAWSDESTVGEVVQEVMSLLCRRQFLSTRGGTKCVISFLSVVRDGLAADGGLFTLCAVPRVALSQLKYICTAPQLSYLQTAQMVLERLIDTSLPPYVLRGQLREAYDPSHWGGLRDVCPLTPLAPRVPMEATLRAPTTDWQGVYVLELYHGPTAAFKDFALQLFPLYFDTAVNTMCTTLRDDASRKDEISGTTVASSPHYMIVTATSGDTGVAAISGFVNAHSPCSVMVLYPLRGVSPVQQMQMLSYDNGTSVRVIGVESDFDFCQRTVKDLFADNYLGRRLESELNVRLSSANSINWGRLIPQVVYYFWSYRKLVTQQGPSGGIAFGYKVDFVVPSGNFGNILAAYVAKLMGLPVGILVVASNNNDVLHEFVKTGVYDIRYRCVVPTASPSIDILKASNVERLLFFLSNGNTDYVRTRMEELEVEKRFEVSGEILQKMQETFWSSSCDEEQCAATIKEVFDTTGHLLDPHTAVAMHAAAQFHRAHVCTPQRPLVVVSTAHWAKFPTPVLRAVLGEELAQTPDSTATTGVAESCRTLYNRVLASCPGATVHPAIGNALAVFEAKLDTFAVRTVKADISVIRNELINLASSRAGNLYSVPG
uniref:Putative threonine synthase n=1 Tax=Trypanosoma congolense (strain IL3000) TaxID=1068625 RepID=G0UQ84_TRYCI|nr:putative threonine synthase [Trypanosoma congolense IL3000]